MPEYDPPNAHYTQIALPAHIKAMRENGETVPGPQNLAGYIAA